MAGTSVKVIPQLNAYHKLFVDDLKNNNASNSSNTISIMVNVKA